MAVYQVLTEPDQVLRTRSKAVRSVNDGVRRVLDNMRETMYAFDGVGLAAIQIGVAKRMIVVDPGDNFVELINPVITSSSGERNASEGCLSVPGKVGLVNRAQKITVKALNRAGEEFELEAEDLFARVLQHEIDHLDGVLFVDLATHIREE